MAKKVGINRVLEINRGVTNRRIHRLSQDFANSYRQTFFQISLVFRRDFTVRDGQWDFDPMGFLSWDLGLGLGLILLAK